MPSYTLTINAKKFTFEADSDTPLLWILRDQLELTGTKYGCGNGSCGACTVHFNGNAIRSCIMPISKAEGGTVVTIEGLAGTEGHALQQAWKELDVPQCGYCQSGQIMNAASLLARNPEPSTAEIQTAMSGNLCRCGTYSRIKKAIALAAQKSMQ